MSTANTLHIAASLDKTKALANPQFVSFEGGEGVGKSTLCVAFCECLQSLGVPVVRTREPGGSALAEQLRAMILNPNTDMSMDTELLLLFAARADHLDKVILPALAQGKWVVCDRFLDSTVAYQGFGRKHGDPVMLETIGLLARRFVGRMPDVSFWLDMPIQEGLARAGKRGALDRIEQETLDFFERVYEGFDYQARHCPARIKRIDARGSIEEVLTRIVACLCAG